MKKTITHKQEKNALSVIIAYFFLCVVMLVSTGLLSQCLDYVDIDNIELSENSEEETEEEKKESKEKNETEKYQNELIRYTFYRPGHLNKPEGHFHKWQNPSADIITPPPDFI